jgi:peroxiredoxin family protein
MAHPDKKMKADKTTIIVHSGDLDKLLSALILGNGFLSMGGQVTLFFTFWGLQRLVKGRLSRAPLSKMNFFGLGARMMKRKMKKVRVASAERLMTDFRDLGGKVIACEMSMDVMGIRKENLDLTLIDEFGTVGSYVFETKNARRTLFI